MHATAADDSLPACRESLQVTVSLGPVDSTPTSLASDCALASNVNVGFAWSLTYAS